MKTFENVDQYNAAITMMEINNKARESWCIADGQNIKQMTSVPCEIVKTFPYAEEVTNELRSKIELWEFINNKPEKYFLYIDEKEKNAINWTGEYLGKVFFGSEYRSNVGDKRQSIEIKAINGLSYYGTYFKSSGNYARIKAKKIKS
jgi:hypothetical protein